MEHTLPSEVLIGAHLRGNEHGWELSSFLPALGKAETFGYACLGGQFQFRLEDSTCEMYWLNADSKDRETCDEWDDYCRRSCMEVRQNFEKHVLETDFCKQAWRWPELRQSATQGLNYMERLVFVAYFVDEDEWLELQQRPSEDKMPCSLLVGNFDLPPPERVEVGHNTVSEELRY